ncbi:hypothetical protein BIW11_02658 [Tropilaelaps mercedesae]|uniref:Uncharacterized protein n=1 Tax=Tropilaelaps mercedesae TaxID=418985 RepID=A0A1V9XZD1_9ACAR|nr:hypothetical protein BIW11_02658 [Tropilaelaps mercedesae]
MSDRDCGRFSIAKQNLRITAVTKRPCTRCHGKIVGRPAYYDSRVQNIVAARSNAPITNVTLVSDASSQINLSDDKTPYASVDNCPCGLRTRVLPLAVFNHRIMASSRANKPFMTFACTTRLFRHFVALKCRVLFGAPDTISPTVSDFRVELRAVITRRHVTSGTAAFVCIRDKFGLDIERNSCWCCFAPVGVTATPAYATPGQLLAMPTRSTCRAGSRWFYQMQYYPVVLQGHVKRVYSVAVA